MPLSALDSFEQIRPLSRKGAVLAVLRSAIVEGRLKPGERLDAAIIATRLGCSRMPVRDALKELEADGLVTCFPSRGTEVSRLTAHDIEQLFGIRLALESLALRRAVVTLTRADLSRLEKLLDQMERTKPIEKWLALNEDFHGWINAASGWPRLIADIERQRRNIGRYVRQRINMQGRELPDDQHRGILQACVDRDADRACAVLEEHLMCTARLLGREYASTSDKQAHVSARASV